MSPKKKRRARQVQRAKHRRNRGAIEYCCRGANRTIRCSACLRRSGRTRARTRQFNGLKPIPLNIE
jgi:hypothetical protein